MQHSQFQGHRPLGFRSRRYMGMAAILVMWLGPFEQTFVALSQRSSILNLTLVGPVVSAEKMFKERGRRTDDRRRTMEAYLSYKLTNEPSVTKSAVRSRNVDVIAVISDNCATFKHSEQDFYPRIHEIEKKKVVPNSENPKVVFSLFEKVKLSVSISPRQLYISKSIEEIGIVWFLFRGHLTCILDTGLE